jgi:hypothetical protein
MPNPSDKQAYSLQITDVGKQELTDYKQARMIKIAELLKNWSDEEREKFGKFLKKSIGRLFNYLTTFLTHRKMEVACLEVGNFFKQTTEGCLLPSTFFLKKTSSDCN